MKAKISAVLGIIIGLGLINSSEAAKSFSDYQRELMQGNQSEFLQKRLARDFYQDKKPVLQSSRFTPSFSQSAAPLPDFKVNQDPFSATYPQTNPRIAIIPGKSFIAVWEETRNGHFDIYGQKYDSNGVAIGRNVKLNDETIPADQYLPDLGVDQSGNLVAVWVDFDSLFIYARRFDSTLTALGSSFRVNTGPANTAWRPAVAVSPGGGFIVVWEDIRSGFNAYGQFYDASGTPVGSNFKINSDLGLFPHFAPRAEYDGAGNLAVVWEDYRNGEADIYFQRYNSSGAAVDTNILVTTDLGSEDQYLPDLDRSFDGRFVISYVDTRNGDPDIYFQRYSAAGVAAGSASKINTDVGGNEQWDPAVGTDSLHRFVIAWADYRATPGIYTQSFDSLGAPQGSNTQVNTLASQQERNSPGIDKHRSGNYTVVWQDRRAGNFDIYGQSLSSSNILQGINFRVNDDPLGAFQKNPAMATTPNGNFYIAWEDYRSGNADIYFRAFDRLGNPLIADTKVNADLTLTDQVSPDLCADENGNLLIAWLDLAFGTRIMAQFYDGALSTIGSNLEISDDTGSVIHNRPACAATADGKFMIVWSDNRNAITTQNIYGQIIDLPFFPMPPFPLNFKINDDTSSFDHLNPRVGADSTGHFAVVWSDSRPGLSRVYLRTYDASGTPQDTSLQVASDSSNKAQYLPDVAVTPQRSRVIVWLEDRAAGTNVFAQRYDGSGVPLGANLAIADPSLGLPRNPRVAMDRNEAFVVTWEDNRNGDWDIFGQFYYASNDSAGEDFRVNNDAGAQLQLSPDVALSRSEAYLAWADARFPGSGLDIFAKLVSYSGLDVDRPIPGLSQLPKTFQLGQNYPNPFNLVTRISYALPKTAEVEITIYDILGRKVKTMALGRQSAGYRTVSWEGRNDSGEEVASGIYFYRLQAGDLVQSRKMTLLK